MPRTRRPVPRHTKIFIGLIAGAAAGIAANFLFPNSPSLGVMQKYVSDPLGRIFLNLLILVVVPLVFSSLALGVAQIGDLRQLGRMGLRTMVYFLVVSALAAVIGLVLVNTIRPGGRLSESTKERLMATYGGQAKELKGAAEQTEFGIQLLVNLVPRNPFASIARPNPDMLALIFVALISGIALTQISETHSGPILKLLDGVMHLMMMIIDLALRLAPYGVAALIFSVTSRFGFDLLVALGMYVATVLIGLAIHQFGVFSILVRALARYSPVKFFKNIRTIMLTAFSTSSSNATLPTSIAVTQENLGVPPKITGFVLPLGATMNMNGTALFEGVTVLFLAQVFGVHLSFGMQIVVVIMCVLTAVGAAGVPSGSIPLLILVLQTVGVPAEGIALILGVDRILDMCRTVLNVTGDVTCCAYIARTEGFALKKAEGTL